MRETLGVVEGGVVTGTYRIPLLMLALLMLVVALPACGESTQDEFVGTWRRFDYKTEWSPPLVIKKTDDGYHATLVYPNSDALPQWDLRRAGDKLKGEAWSSRGPVEIEVIYRGQSGHIAYRGAAMPGFPVNEVEFVRVSTSTAIPTPSPL